jgi:hypothetical protein
VKDFFSFLCETGYVWKEDKGEDLPVKINERYYDLKQHQGCIFQLFPELNYGYIEGRRLD